MVFLSWFALRNSCETSVTLQKHQKCRTETEISLVYDLLKQLGGFFLGFFLKKSANIPEITALIWKISI